MIDCPSSSHPCSLIFFYCHSLPLVTRQWGSKQKKDKRERVSSSEASRSDKIKKILFPFSFFCFCAETGNIIATRKVNAHKDPGRLLFVRQSVLCCCSLFSGGSGIQKTPILLICTFELLHTQTRSTLVAPLSLPHPFPFPCPPPPPPCPLSVVTSLSKSLFPWLIPQVAISQKEE